MPAVEENITWVVVFRAWAVSVGLVHILETSIYPESHSAQVEFELLEHFWQLSAMQFWFVSLINFDTLTSLDVNVIVESK